MAQEITVNQTIIIERVTVDAASTTPEPGSPCGDPSTEAVFVPTPVSPLQKTTSASRTQETSARQQTTAEKNAKARLLLVEQKKQKTTPRVAKGSVVDMDGMRAKLMRKRAELVQKEKRLTQELRRANDRNANEDTIKSHLSMILKVRQHTERNEQLDAKVVEAKTERMLMEDTQSNAAMMEMIATELNSMNDEHFTNNVLNSAARMNAETDKMAIQTSITDQAMDAALSVEFEDEAALQALRQELLG